MGKQYKMIGHSKVGNMSNKEIGTMSENIKLYGTGSAPHHLNLNTTTKDFSNQESTNPSNGLLEFLDKYVIIEDNMILINPQIANNLIIVDR